MDITKMYYELLADIALSDCCFNNEPFQPEARDYLLQHMQLAINTALLLNKSEKSKTLDIANEIKSFLYALELPVELQLENEKLTDEARKFLINELKTILNKDWSKNRRGVN